jgi:hypothetical protein
MQTQLEFLDGGDWCVVLLGLIISLLFVVESNALWNEFKFLIEHQYIKF